MASRKNLVSKPSRYIFPTTSDLSQSHETTVELDEAELWNNYHTSGAADQSRKGLPSSVPRRGSRSKVEGGGGRFTSASLPVNIPDWSKILKEDFKEQPKWESDEDEDEDEEEEEAEEEGFRIRVPPHEYLARTRGASLSVHEGIGRTLKGRDLRSVRNAIWKEVGFED